MRQSGPVNFDVVLFDCLSTLSMSRGMVPRTSIGTLQFGLTIFRVSTSTTSRHVFLLFTLRILQLHPCIYIEQVLPRILRVIFRYISGSFEMNTRLSLHLYKHFFRKSIDPQEKQWTDPITQLSGQKPASIAHQQRLNSRFVQI